MPINCVNLHVSHPTYYRWFARAARRPAADFLQGLELILVFLAYELYVALVNIFEVSPDRHNLILIKIVKLVQ